jgi:hypothetical protein
VVTDILGIAAGVRWLGLRGYPFLEGILGTILKATQQETANKVRYLKHGMVLTEAAGDAEGVVRDGAEFGHIYVQS